MKNESLIITKASGERVPFLYPKLENSLTKAGANQETIDYVIREVKNELYDGISTKKIYRKAFSLLKASRLRPVGAKYKLKQAIMELGPSGFPFEIYVSEIFKHKGFKIKVGEILQGACVKHEVDVIAENQEKILFIECKYHTNPGSTCDVKVPLYINSRFMDIEKQSRKNPEKEKKIHEGWLVTNTRFTTDAIQYGTCAGLHLLGWDYPEKGSLKQMIDESGLHPLTALTSINNTEKQKLLAMKYVLCQELDEKVLKNAGIHLIKIKGILDECNKLCHR